MKYNKLLIAILTVLLVCISLESFFASENNKKLYVIPVSETVEPGMAAYIERALNDVEEDKDGLIIFKLDSFGGRVDAALDIVDVISNIPKVKTIAYVDKRAISAGALIALASNQLYMKGNTLIGDCAPIIQTQEGQQMAGEKIQTVLRAKFRALAKKNNYPVVLSESMVTIDMEVYQVIMNNETRFMDKKEYDDLTEAEKKTITSKKTVVAEGELLTMDDIEAHELGFSQKSVKDLDELISLLGFQPSQVVTLEENWSENLVRFLQPFLPILMLVGIGAIYTEMKAPGFGFPGALGILCLALVFFNQYLVGLADYTELILLVIGALLLGIEVFVLPGFGIAGISALLVLGIGLVLSFQNFVIPDPALPWEGKLLLNNLARVMVSFVLALLLSLFSIRFVLPKISKVVKGPYLDATLAHSRVDGPEDVAVNLGDTGVAKTPLRPSGKIMIGGKKIDAITQGEFIEANRNVKVVKLESNQVIVAPDNH